MLSGSIFVFPIDSPLFSLAFVHLNRADISVRTAAVPLCKVLCKRKQNVR